MKIKWQGKFDGNVASLPEREHMPGAVRFKEFEDLRKMGIFMNTVALAVITVLLILTFIRCGFSESYLWGFILPMAALIPHEFLHAICFEQEAFIYTNLKNGILFVVGLEEMSRARFIFMSLLPNIIFGFIPFLIGMIFPELGGFAVFGALSIGMGAGDFYNVINALTQMPKGAKTYLSGFNSYWYMPRV